MMSAAATKTTTMMKILRTAVPRSTRGSGLVANISKRSMMMTFGDTAKLREKFEEDRYMKQQENEWKEKLRALKEQEAKDRNVAHQLEVVDPVKKDIEALLAETGDKISDEGLEALAKFRLDL
mmetsp:Transcript_48809/g.118122  ORF Transcript_48809/g.118122 Transcript_48809/m.118122 type:complete len:123 (+) Transcript_48809:160-528(+)